MALVEADECVAAGWMRLQVSVPSTGLTQRSSAGVVRLDPLRAEHTRVRPCNQSIECDRMGQRRTGDKRECHRNGDSSSWPEAAGQVFDRAPEAVDQHSGG